MMHYWNHEKNIFKANTTSTCSIWVHNELFHYNCWGQEKVCTKAFVTLQTLWRIVLSCKPSVLVPVAKLEILHFTPPTKTLILVGRQKTNFMTNKLLAKIRGAVKAVFAILIQSFIGLAWSGWCWWWLGGRGRKQKHGDRFSWRR